MYILSTNRSNKLMGQWFIGECVVFHWLLFLEDFAHNFAAFFFDEVQTAFIAFDELIGNIPTSNFQALEMQKTRVHSTHHVPRHHKSGRECFRIL